MRARVASDRNAGRPGWPCAAVTIACAGFEVSGAHAVAVACAMLALATFVATLTIAAMVRP